VGKVRFHTGVATGDDWLGLNCMKMWTNRQGFFRRHPFLRPESENSRRIKAFLVNFLNVIPKCPRAHRRRRLLLATDPHLGRAHVGREDRCASEEEMSAMSAAAREPN